MEASIVSYFRMASSTKQTIHKMVEIFLLFDSKEFHNHLEISLYYVLNTSLSGAVF